jgi:pimeloyl-ACP methyl ester carboxylesterase
METTAPESRYVKANGLTIHYTQAGCGLPLILLHGSFDCTGSMWAGQIPAFAQAFRVLVPDARGHGRTDNPKDRITLPLLAEDVAAFSEALALRQPTRCGISMGGRTALEAGMLYPDVFRALVVGAAQTHRPFPPIMTQRSQAIGIRGPGDVDPGVLERNDPGRVACLRASHSQGDDQWKRLLGAISYIWQHDLRPLEDYRKITVPALAIVGDRDELVPVESVVEMYRFLRDAELAVVPGHDHCSLFQRRDSRFNDLVLDFLSRRIRG